MLAGITHEALLDVLSRVPPFEIEAVALRRRLDSGGTLEQHELDSATKQLIAYTDECKKALGKLANLPPVPARDLSLVAYYPL